MRAHSSEALKPWFGRKTKRKQYQIVAGIPRPVILLRPARIFRVEFPRRTSSRKDILLKNRLFDTLIKSDRINISHFFSADMS